MFIGKAVITAAGLGTRLFPVSKEIPKEMLPLFSLNNGVIGLKPIVHVIFEGLFHVGIREFCFIVGRGKRVLEDYFTPDTGFIDLLQSKGLGDRAECLKEFYSMVFQTKMFFINQPEPRGFGDAVLHAEPFVGVEPFILHAGDDIVLSRNCNHFRRLIEVFEEYDADATVLLEEVEDPRAYGVALGKAVDNYGNVLKLTDIVEKPEKPPSNIAVIAIYVFRPKIFNYIRKVKPDSRGEIQLTHAVKLMIDDGGEVYGVKLKPGERRLDVGTPQTYWKALYESYHWALDELLNRNKRS